MFTVRKPLTKDYPGIVDCIRTVRGADCYPPEIYDPILLESNAHMRFLAAVDEDDNVVGIIALLQDSFESGLSLVGTLAVYDEFTGRGIASQLLEKSAQFLFDGGVPSVRSHVVASHLKVQTKYEKMAFTPTGFYFGITERSKDLSGGILRSRKCSLVNYVKAGEKQAVGSLYLPKQLQELASNIYKDLGVDFSIGNTQETPAHSKISLEKHSDHLFTYVQIQKCGVDLSLRIQALLDRANLEKESFIAYINMNCPSASEGYFTLLSLGFQFSGFSPLSQTYEWLLMCLNPANSVVPAELVTTEKSNQLLLEVLSLGKKSQ